jgi:serine/threonine protein kinase
LFYLLTRPRDALEGKQLGDWVIQARAVKAPDQSGGHFSSGYYATHIKTGQPAFIKAMDLHDASRDAALRGTSVFDEAHRLLSDYRFERDLSLHCRDVRLSKIVVAQEHNEIRLSEDDPLMSTVGYLVFDKAAADVRQHVSECGFDVVWNLSTLKEVAAGILQLHAHGIVHQDVKPSNVLLFPDARGDRPEENDETGRSPKLADLGCAHLNGNEKSPRGRYEVPGDRTYAPIELLYGGSAEPSWSRRLRTDLFLLGNFATFLFSGASITALIGDNLAAEFHWEEYEGDYEDILPEVLVAFSLALDLVSCDIDVSVREEMVDVIRRLCHPDPTHRGYWGSGRRSHGSQYAVQPFATRFAELAYKAGRGIISFDR